MTAIGLKTHIWNNNLKSLALLAGFPVLLILLTYASVLLMIGYGGIDIPAGVSWEKQHWYALTLTRDAAPFAVAAALVWFVAAFLWRQQIIDAAAGAKRLERSDNPRVYNLLENLTISRGLPMPDLRIIETASLNAYASGLGEKDAVITVTRGLVDTLDDDELEAVLAHELTHVINRDVRLLVIAVIFVGIISFVGEILARGVFRGSAARMGGARRGKSGNAGAFILIAFAVIALCWVLAILIRFAMSRSREFMADAGAVELTKKPDAMISALRKVSGRSAVKKAPRELRQMFLHDDSAGFAGLFMTHPPIEKRIAALEAFGGVEPPAALPA
ncbi:MAG: M48 family metallopeptidase [Oceanicaulis sp.]